MIAILILSPLSLWHSVLCPGGFVTTWLTRWRRSSVLVAGDVSYVAVPSGSSSAGRFTGRLERGALARGLF